jgi:hypothetical protein
MTSRTTGLPRDPFWRSKLELIKRLTREGNEGDRYFLQVTRVPLTSLYLEAGRVNPNGNGTDREINMRLVGQPEHFPTVPDGQIAMMNEGYRRHVARAVRTVQSNGPNATRIMPFPMWKVAFQSITDVIDNLIAPHHGVCCHTDGDVSNEGYDNIHYLHVCDVINIVGCRHNNLALPEVVVQTAMFTNVTSTMVDVLTAHCLNETQLEFFYNELDFFYTLYAYYVNGSFLPIRTLVPIESTIFRESSFFMNDDHFRNHQVGKLEELNRTESTVIDNLIFKSI